MRAAEMSRTPHAKPPHKMAGRARDLRAVVGAAGRTGTSMINRGSLSPLPVGRNRQDGRGGCARWPGNALGVGLGPLLRLHGARLGRFGFSARVSNGRSLSEAGRL